MDQNAFVLYADVTEVYEKLISFCTMHGFVLKDAEKKYYSVSAHKISIFFWRRLQMELKIIAVEKKKAEVTVIIHKYGRRRADLEMKYRITVENFLSKK